MFLCKSMFDELFQSLLLQVDGCRAVILIGSDGLVVQSKSSQADCPCEAIAAQCSQFLKSGIETVEALSEQELQELIIISRSQKLLLHVINKSYFIALLFSQEAFMGKARYYLQKADSILSKELS